MATDLERRIKALETSMGSKRALSGLSDQELDRRILQLHLGRDPTAAELSEWRAVPPAEAERRNREMLAAVRKQLQHSPEQPEVGHA